MQVKDVAMIVMGCRSILISLLMLIIMIVVATFQRNEK